MSLKRLSIVLLFISLILVFANIFTKKKADVSETGLKYLYGFQIDSIFRSTLSEFSITTTDIINRKSPYKNFDSLLFTYKVILPGDLPIVSILYDLKHNYSDFDVEIFCREIKINGDSELEIRSGNHFKLFAELSIDKNRTRNFGNFAFVLSGLEDISNDKKERLLKLYDPNIFTISPTQKGIDLASIISEGNKKSVLYLADTKYDQNFSLKPSFSKQRLSLSVKNIATAFKKYPNVIIDEKSELYNSNTFQYIGNMFKLYGMKLYTTKDLINLDVLPDDRIQHEFNKIVKTLSKDQSKYFIVSADKYDLLFDAINKLKKLGYKQIQLDL